MTTSLLLIALCVAITPATARALGAPGACRQVIDAEKKQIMTPSRVYLSESAGERGAKVTTLETISTGSAMSIHYEYANVRAPAGVK